MKTLTKLALVLIPTITLSMTATAHDPKLHAKKAEKADCSKMDHSKIDMKDPVDTFNKAIVETLAKTYRTFQISFSRCHIRWYIFF
ncbi:hypothetical protein H4J78_11820 [Colwellia sp. BRX10-7]|nr:hypothetical protein [Colwellia sp. BRX10-7]